MSTKEEKIKEIKPDFGDYVWFEHLENGIPEEYAYKVIESLRTNAWVEAPIQLPRKLKRHDHFEDVIGCICNGIGEEDNVLYYRVKDVKWHRSPLQEELAKQREEILNFIKENTPISEGLKGFSAGGNHNWRQKELLEEGQRMFIRKLQAYLLEQKGDEDENK